MMGNDKAMCDFLTEAKSILDKIETHQEVHAQQLEMYEKMIQNSISLHKERMDSFEKRWAGTRNVLIALISLFFLSFVSDKLALRDRPTQEQIDTQLKEYVPIEYGLRGYGVVIDDTYEIFETTGDLTHDEAEELSSQTKKSVQKEILPNYVERSVVKVK